MRRRVSVTSCGEISSRSCGDDRAAFGALGWGGAEVVAAYAACAGEGGKSLAYCPNENRNPAPRGEKKKHRQQESVWDADGFSRPVHAQPTILADIEMRLLDGLESQGIDVELGAGEFLPERRCGGVGIFGPNDRRGVLDRFKEEDVGGAADRQRMPRVVDDLEAQRDLHLPRQQAANPDRYQCRRQQKRQRRQPGDDPPPSAFHC